MRRLIAAIAMCGLTVAVGLVAVCAGEEVWWSASHRAEKLSIEGVSNFGRVNPRLYRGAQPTHAGFVALKALGVETVVRLSMGEEGAEAEAGEVQALGMQFVNLPWSAVHEPSRDQVATFLALLHDDPQRRVFVHCKAGSDRTGLMVALARIALDHWTADAALSEMKAFHYRYLFLPHLQRYVEAFAVAQTPGY